jgi:16S rRNA G966 N2-methylase RsmD
VERHRTALQHLRSNLEKCQVDPERGLVHAGAVSDFLELLPSIQPDLVYADPPYGSGDAALLLEFFNGIDYPSIGLFILEHERELTTAGLDRLRQEKTKSFGQTSVSFFVPDGRKPS